MVKVGTPIIYRMTQADITAGLATPLSGGFIEIIDVSNIPTGVIYQTGAAGVAPSQLETSSSLQKHNFTATIPPTVNDDFADGYSVGSRWVDITNDESYICVDSTTGFAVWSQTTVGTIAEVSGLQTVLDAKLAKASNLSDLPSVATAKTNLALVKNDVGLGNVDNTTDLLKPVSTATQTALNGKQASLGFTAENSVNKVTTITSSSTDTQYPSAKLAYDQLLLKETTSNKGIVNGYAGLDAGGKVPQSQLPTLPYGFKIIAPEDIIPPANMAIHLFGDDLITSPTNWDNKANATATQDFTLSGLPISELVQDLGGRRGLKFDNVDDYGETGTNINIGTNYGLFAVFRTGSNVTNIQDILSEVFVANTVEFKFGIEASQFRMGHYNGAWIEFATGTPVINTPYTMIADFDGSQFRIKINGGTAATLAQTSVPTFSEANTIRLGRRWDSAVAAANIFNGHILCVVAKRNGAFTTTEIEQLEGWAAWYYGRVSDLPVGHKYKSYPPLVAA